MRVSVPSPRVGRLVLILSLAGPRARGLHRQQHRGWV